LHFLHVLEFIRISKILKENEKSKIMVHSVGPASSQGLALLAQPNQENGSRHWRIARVECGHRAGFTHAAALWRPAGGKVLP
jgi:hypothetical protein